MILHHHPITRSVHVVLPRIVLAVAAIIVATSTAHTLLCWFAEAHYTPSMAARDQAALMRADEQLRAEIATLRAQVEH